MEVYQSVVQNIQYDRNLIANLFLLRSDSQNRASLYHDIINTLKQYRSTTQGIRSISIVPPDDESIIYDADTDSSPDNIWRDTADLREIDAYKRARDSSQTVIMPTARFANSLFYMQWCTSIADFN